MGSAEETLVLLSPGFPANEADTTCLPAHQVFVRALHKNFPALRIIVIAFQYPYVSATYTWNGVSIISLNGAMKGKIHRLLLWRRAWQTLKKINRQHNIKGLLSFWVNECALIGRYFGKKHHLKHYAWITGQDAKKGNQYVKLLHPKANEIFAMSDFLATRFFKNYHIKPFKVIPNGIDTQLFSNKATERSIDILAAGSLIPLKQYDIFIEVLGLVQKQIAGIVAMLCGKGPEEQKLKTLIAADNLTKNLQLAGEKQHLEVLALMQQCKIFLHTSNWEGFSTVCLEALYAGAHVISFFSPMEKEIPHWHIVKTKEEMAATALELLLNPSTQFTPVLPYAMDDIAKQVMELYE